MKKIIFAIVCFAIFNCSAFVDHFSSYPYISGDTFRSIADFTIDDEHIRFSADQVKDGDIIFVKTDFVDNFFSTIHHNSTARYVLITHNSDLSITTKYVPFLNDEKLIAWFGQNGEIIHPKFHAIPIGIANLYW